MPSFTRRHVVRGALVELVRWGCDGCDPPRARDEAARHGVVMVVLRGRFGFRDARGRAIASPTTALAVPAGHEYIIHHPDGGDLTLALTGELAEAIIGDGPVARPLSLAAFASLHRLAHADHDEPVAIDERAAAIADLMAVDPPGPTGRADREIAEAIDYAIDLAAGRGLELAGLADAANVSVGHASRAYRRVRRRTIHQQVVETRLRHALAYVLDTDDALADVAVATGFANQGHFGNAFALRFGLTPGQLRRDRSALARLTAG